MSQLDAGTKLEDLDWAQRPRILALKRLGLQTLGDLLRHFPRRYEDRVKFDRFPDQASETPVCLFGVVKKTIYRRFGSRRIFEARIEDEAAGVLGSPLTCRWFNMPWVQKMIAGDQRIVVYGKPRVRGKQVVMEHPEFEVIEEDAGRSLHFDRITPIHPAGDGVTTRVLREIIQRAIQETDLSSIPLLWPGNAVSERVWSDVHFPESAEEQEEARQQLVREEFFGIQLVVCSRHAAARSQGGTSKLGDGHFWTKVESALPFELTLSQRKVMEEISADLASPHRMNRLLQGDVGSGKTLVALRAMLQAAESGWQAALMAPTQILAEQHYLNFRRILDPLGIPVVLRTAARKESSGGTPDATPGTGVLPGFEATRYSKRNLPHFERPWAKYAVTFTTRERELLSETARDIVLDAILHASGSRYHLYAACVMPDHVHLLIEPSMDEAGNFCALSEILHSLKSFTAHEINKAKSRTGSLWEKESFDRIIRSESDLQEKFSYITRNPWDNKVVPANEDYPWVWWPGRDDLRGAHASRVSDPASRRIPPLVIGTHALLFENAGLERLGLVVIDEQHKFGVLQRSRLIARGDAPDVLVMTATPIPRTITQTLYGDLDVSIIREKPAGRGKVITAVREPSKLPDIIKFLRDKISEGRQAYVVYPLVEESEKLDVKSARVEFEKWTELLAPATVGLIHGRLDADEKELVMRKFREGTISVLVATTVIEVGVDVPNACIMLIEEAGRFGLSQIHQLRGRIGRGAEKSYCILLQESPGEQAREKLAILEKTSDGFEIAEADLRLRGPGDMLGTAQAGLPPLRLGDLIRDGALMTEARKVARGLLEADPFLTDTDHEHFRRFVEKAGAQLAAAEG
ncbi:MAG: DEAD/DEAH box helicase [Terrimicrobiaceae bacterium]